uniref:CLAVATA3/ESR-like protein n=1 Tax=Oryza punctata TaxID=4537 RepID=A0A0E0L4F0_ORYPU
MACCRIVLVFFFCVCVLVATDVVKGTSAATNSAAASGGGGRWTELTAGSPATRYSAGADEFRGSKRRIPKGPDPIHNRRAGKTTVAPRRRD